MAKRFKLRLSRVITSFQSCRSKDTATLPADPVPSFLRLSSPTLIHVDFPLQPATPPASKPHHRSSFKSHVSSAFTSVGCGIRSNRKSSAQSHTLSPPEFKWKKEDKWHVVAKTYNDDETPRQKIYNSSASGNSDDELFPQPPPPPPTAEKKKLRIKKKRTIGGRIRISTSSAETGLFSSEADEEESETLVSTSRSLSTSDSSTSDLKTIHEIPSSRRRLKKNKKGKRGKRSGRGSGGSGGDSPARLSVFKRLIPCGVEGKVKESFAVVKKSEDPYEDFKRSMMEMIMEKQMFEERELEQLLQCFLSLNSRHHHGVIVEAFTEIWEALFCGKISTNPRVSSTALQISS